MNTADEIIQKLFRFCAYQERCKQDIRKKMRELEIDFSEYDLILDYLEEENFLNEARFACAFAGGRFRIKRWGKHKIRNELRKKNIDRKQIERALVREIPDDDYLKSLEYLIDKRVSISRQQLSAVERQKLFRFLQQKGYEWEVIKTVWDQGEDTNS